MLDQPEVEDQNRQILWSNLPYCGLYQESPYQGKYCNLDTPFLKQITVYGKPLPIINNGVNKDLRLIGFNNQELKAPVTTVQQWRLLTYSPWLEYRVKWLVSSKCKIAFYTPNYLLDTDPSTSQRRTLLISKNGPCFFDDVKGKFYFTNVVEFCVVTDKDVEVKLKVKCRAPCSIYFPTLKLYKPVPYRLEDECIFANETRINDFSRDVTFIPTKKYVHLTAAMRAYLIATSVLIDFTPILQLQKLVAATPVKVLENLSTLSYPIDSQAFYILFPQSSTGEYRTIPAPDNKLLTLTYSAVIEPSDALVRLEYELLIHKKATSFVGDDSAWGTWGASAGSINSRGFDPYVTDGLKPPTLSKKDSITPSNGALTFSRTIGSFALLLSFNERDSSMFGSPNPIESVTVTKLTISYEEGERD